MGSLCNADGSKIMTEDDGYETIVPDLSASEVTQADRDAAKNWSTSNDGTLLSLSVAMARHRQASITQQAEEVARLRVLVKSAYREGFYDGDSSDRDDGDMHADCAECWSISLAFKSLNEKPGGEETQ